MVTRAICVPIKEDCWYTTRTIGWRILDVDSETELARGSFLNQLKDEVREKYGDIRFIETY